MATVPQSQVPDSNEVAEVIGRYSDAYKVAKTTVSFGEFIKIVGVVLGGLILLCGFLVLNTGSTQVLVGATAFAVITGLIFYFLGVLVCAQGQVLQATLDAAVYASP